jgi:hypothetical protein
MVRYIKYLLPIVLLLVASCSKFTAPERFEGDVYSLAGLLIAGESISLQHPVYITRSAAIETFNPNSIFVDNATVVIKDITPGIAQTQFPLSYAMGMYIDPAANIIQAEHTYKIEIEIPGTPPVIISAQTTVPKQGILVPDYLNNNIPGEGYGFTEEPMNTMKFSDVDRKYPLAINTGDASGTFNFMAEMYCLEDFSTSLEFTTPVFGFTNPDAAMEDSYNAPGESVRRIKFMGSYLSQAQDGVAGNHLVVKDYRQAFVFYGRYRVTLYLADDNYYRYTYMPEGYFHGGVNGGLGYFGSASGGVMYTKIVK